MKTGKRIKIQIRINFDINYGIRRIATNDLISEDKSEMKEATTTGSKTISSMKDCSDYKVFVFQQETTDNMNFIAETSADNMQILTSKSEISIASKTNRQNLIKAIEISISRVCLKYAEDVPELQQLYIEFIDIFRINYKDLKISNIILTREMLDWFCDVRVAIESHKR